jgi:branched-chain amino acid aminotransferase
MSIFFNYNGNLFKEATPVITPDNRSLKYGDGLFETIKMVNDKIISKDYHFERLYYGMKTLEFEIPAYLTPAYLEKEIIALAEKNGHNALTKVRLMLFRGNGGLYDLQNHLPDYIIQTWRLPVNIKLNKIGFNIDIYPYTKKSCDMLANIKTNNFLPYALAAIYAKKNILNDCIILNTNNKICETTVANIFIIKDKLVYTPSLREGCIAGVMRRWLIENVKPFNNTIIEREITVEELQQADEVFLTNSIYPISWVKQFQNIKYTNQHIKHLYTYLQQPFY